MGLNAYRAELAGVFGVLCLLEALCLLHHIKQGAITLGLDGEQAAKQAQGEYPVAANQASADLVTAIRKKITKLSRRFGLAIKIIWIEGHQLEKHGSEDYLGYLNRMVDSMAKAFLEERRTTPPPEPHRYEQEGWSIHVDGIKQECLDKDRLYEYTYHTKHSRQYWAKRHHITPRTEANIDWDIIREAFGGWAWGKRKWFTKHLAGFSATGRVMLRREEWEHSRCPCCDIDNEDAVHITSCPKAREQWSHCLQEFEAKLTTLQTDPQIGHAILAHLRRWPRISPPGAWQTNNTLINTAIQDQHDIGWQHFLWGRISIHWKDAQAAWLARIATKWKRSSTQWAIHMTRAVLEMNWSMWEHRNDILHDPDHPWKVHARKQRHHLIRDMFLHYDEDLFLPKDRWLFQHSNPSVIIQKDDAKQKMWVASVKAAYTRAARYREQMSTTPVYNP